MPTPSFGSSPSGSWSSSRPPRRSAEGDPRADRAEGSDDEKERRAEIRAGTGGDEAGLFAHDLWRMYSRFAERMGWKVEILSLNGSGAGVVKEVIALIEGARVYRRPKYDSGVHRVQRVPATESGGRVHTSTATVAVLPKAGEVDVAVEPGDLRIDTFARPGPAASMSTPPDRRCASPTCRPASWFPSRTRSRRSRTERRP